MGEDGYTRTAVGYDLGQLWKACKMGIALVWPPIKSSEYGGIDTAASYFAWFFGDALELILLPVDGLTEIDTDPPYSLGSLRNLSKVNIVRTSLDELARSAKYILVRTKDPQPLPGNIKCRKMTGSMAVNIPEGNINDPLYYYIGSPAEEKQDAYLCVLFTYWLSGGRNESFLTSSQARIQRLKRSLGKRQAVSVFGTGPSVSEVNPDNHKLDASIICNTIVKDKEFCRQLDLVAIVASDCHFHFSSSKYSFRFLSDLWHQLQESNALYITFDKFAPFVMAKIPGLEDRICGIPAGRQDFGFDFDHNFSVCPGESVVNMFLFPVACYLSDTVRLCGFTGRAPSDNFFWGHSSRFQYDSLMVSVRQTHPAFFADRDYNLYSDIVGKQLSERIRLAKSEGLRVCSLTTSFYPGLEVLS